MQQTPISDKNSLVQTHEIDTTFTDAFSRLKPSGLANLLIQSAIKSADSLGFGFKELKNQSLIWVLNKLTIEIYKPLFWYDTAAIETWPKNINRIFYIRDFLVLNQNNEIVAKATSAWLAIDINSRRPKTLKTEQIDHFTKLKNKHALETPPEKLDPLNGTYFKTIEANYADIDLNQHVTSIRYIDWMMDTFSMPFHKEHFANKISINYLKETLINERITLQKESNNSTFDFEGNNLDKNTTAFRGQIQFKKQ